MIYEISVHSLKLRFVLSIYREIMGDRMIVTVEVGSHCYAQGELIELKKSGSATVSVGGKEVSGTPLTRLEAGSRTVAD